MDHDRLFKELLTTFFADFLQLFLPELGGYVDFASFEFLDKEVFTDVTLGEKHEADLIVKARFQGSEAFFLVHVENQSKAQADFGRRMFRYFARLYEAHDLPVYPVVVFSYDAPEREEPSEHQVVFPDRTVLDFRFRVIQLNRLNWRDFLRSQNPVAAALMAKMRIAPADRPRVKLECLRLLATLRLDPARTQLISGFVDSYLRLNARERQVFERELAAISPPEQEATMEIMTSWKEEGLAEGRHQGLTQGRAEGARQKTVALTARLLLRRFGPLPERLEAQIGELPTEQMETLAEDVLDMADISALEAWLARGEVGAKEVAAKLSKRTDGWPVLKRYDQDHLAKIALPLGGIGTGTVSLGGRGNLKDWEVVNRPAKGFTPPNTFFALRTQSEGEEAVTRCLEGPIDLSEYEGDFGSRAQNHGLPRFRECAFEAAYPLGQVVLSDPDVPLDVRLEAFNPFIPGDSSRSGLPVAILRFVLSNKSDQPVMASVCGSVQNFIGQDGSQGTSKDNVNEWRSQDGLAGLLMRSAGVDPQAEQWGTMAVATTATEDVSYRTAWAKLSWGDTLLDFWDDFSGDGRLENRDAEGVDAPMASLAVGVTVGPHETRTVTFLIAWHFPNRLTWTPAEGGSNGVGNFYATQFADAWDAAQHVAAQLPQLEDDTVAFVRAFCDGDLPDVVKEAALFNLSTLRTQTCFRTADRRFFGWEGCGDKSGCCHGTCTHVWNYEQATAFLFPDLARSMRETEFGLATAANGLMSFRVDLPVTHARRWTVAAADGQMGCLMKLYRDWRLCGDDDWLRWLWPEAKSALEFCWIPGGWDADKDGVMEGCQHNTMDVEYYGPNPQMGGWYLGALRACEEMARHLGEIEFADECRDLFTRGSRWMDENLFNGEYYEHHIWPPKDAAAIAPGLRHESMGASDLADPELQLGAGCLVDQLVGQYMADVCGLGPLLDPGHMSVTLASILRHNFQTDLHGHFNHLRTFALGGESALLMASYPRGRRPKRPFPHYNEVMTGFEYTAAVGMLYAGQTEDGLRVIQAIRDRYDGRRRSPFDEAECGHHYARAMASWAAVLALTGFRFDAVTGGLTLNTPAEGASLFFSTGSGWGTLAQTDGVLTLHLGGGTLTVRSVTVGGQPHSFDPRTLAVGQTLALA